MILSDTGRKFIETWEGLSTVAYDDGTGTWTIGYGHIDGVRNGDQCTQAQADAWLTGDVKIAEDAVNQDVTVPLTQAQFDVLVSFTMNEGVEALNTSTILRELNSGNYTDIPTQLMRWDLDRQNGQLVVVKGLSNRRTAEGVVWVQGSPPVNPVQPDGSRTLNGATVVLVGGLASVATPVEQAITQAQPLWSLGSMSGLLIGGVIVLGALWVAYARLDDAGLIPWNRKYTPVAVATSTDAPAPNLQNP